MLPIGMALLTTVMPGHRLPWRVWLGLATGPFGEPLSWLMAVGTAISVLGVWTVVRAERERDKPLHRNSP